MKGGLCRRLTPVATDSLRAIYLAEVMKTRSTDFSTIVAQLRAILQEHASTFVVTADTAEEYCLEIPYSPKFKKSFPVAWVNASKSCVSFHCMPIYFAPVLQTGLSAGLKSRMHGKSCFNFKVVDETLFKELRQLTIKGFELSRKAGVV
jgi:hypothetical protein